MSARQCFGKCILSLMFLKLVFLKKQTCIRAKVDRISKNKFKMTCNNVTYDLTDLKILINNIFTNSVDKS